jgi:hypothetical protein
MTTAFWNWWGRSAIEPRGESLAASLHKEYIKRTEATKAAQTKAAEPAAQEIRAAVVTAALANADLGQACVKFETEFTQRAWELAEEQLRQKDGFNSVWFRHGDTGRAICVRYQERSQVK